MNTIFLYLILLLSIPIQGLAQDLIKETDKKIREIKKELGNYTKIEQENTPEGTRIVYKQDNDLRLIRITANVQKTERVIEWYYIQGEIAYIETNWYDEVNRNNVYKELFYFDKGRLVHWYDTRDQIHDNNSPEFLKMDSGLVAYCKRAKEDALK